MTVFLSGPGRERTGGKASIRPSPSSRVLAQLSGDSPTVLANLARAYAASGKKREAIKLLDDLKKRSNSTYSRGSEIVIYAALGDTDRAMSWLQKGYQESFNPGVLLRPGFGSLRSDPRFAL